MRSRKSILKFFQGRRGRRAIRSAVLSSNMNAISKVSDQLIGEFSFQPDELDLFTLYGAQYRNTVVPGEASNFALSPSSLTDSKYDLFFVSANVFLYESDWYRTILNACCDALHDDGLICVAGYKVDGEPVLLGLPPDRFCEWVGGRPLAESGRYQAFAKPRRDTFKPMSVFDWYRERGPLYARFADAGFDGAKTIALKDVNLLSAPRTPLDDDEVVRILDAIDGRPPTPSEVPVASFKSLEYLSLGSGYKSAYVKALLQHYFGPDYPIRYLDHGSGAGFVPAQLLLESNLTILESWGVEPLNSFLAMTADFSKYFDDTVRERFYLARATAEDYVYGTSLSAISFMHMLFLISPEQRRSVLERSWDALEAGGVLLVLEIPKTEKSSSAGYYDRMLTLEEIEGELGRLGGIDRWHHKEVRQITVGEAGDKAIFRAVRKVGEKRP